MRFQYRPAAYRVRIADLSLDKWYRIVPITIKTAVRDNHIAFAVKLSNDRVNFKCSPIFGKEYYNACYGSANHNWIGTDTVELL